MNPIWFGKQHTDEMYFECSTERTDTYKNFIRILLSWGSLSLKTIFPNLELSNILGHTRKGLNTQPENQHVFHEHYTCSNIILKRFEGIIYNTYNSV